MLTNFNFGIYKRAVLSIGGVVILLLCACMIGMMVASPPPKEYGLLPLVIVLGLFGAFLIFTRPTVGFALMLFLIPLGPLTRLIGGERTITLALGVFLLGIYGARVLILHEKVKFDRVSLLACAFIAWGIITSVWAPSPGVSIRFAIRLGQMVASYVLVLNYCRSQRQLNILTLSFVAGTLVAATVSIFRGVTFSSTERATLAEGYDPNYFSTTVSLAMILVFYYFYKTEYKLSRAILILSIIVVGYTIIRAESRGVWIAVPASFLISSILLRRNSKIVKYSITIIVVMIVLVTSAYYSGIINEAVVSRFKTLTSGDPVVATSRRNVIWETGLEMIKDNPLLGVGLGSFKSVYKDYTPSTTDTSYYAHRARGAHNTFIAVFAETGLIGFIIFSGIFIYLFKNIWLIKDPITRFMFMWLFACLILESLTLVTYNVPWFWFVLLLIALRAKFEKRTHQLIASKNYSYIPG